jgi:hypothetical protein
VITHLYYGYQICESSNLYKKLPKGKPRDQFVEKFGRPPNTTKFLFKNEDKILLIKESIEISHLINDFTYKLQS